MTFLTPDEWLRNPGVRRRYERVVFSRSITGRMQLFQLSVLAIRPLTRRLSKHEDHLQSYHGSRTGGTHGFLFSPKPSDRAGWPCGAGNFAVKQNQGDTGSLSILKDWEALDVLN